jgi:hypothetical protein
MKFSVPAATLCGALCLGATPASAIDLPTMKPGLWETSMTREGMQQKMTGTKMCMDAATQKEIMDAGMGAMKSMCTKNDIRREGNRVYTNAECKFGESAAKVSSVTTFTGDTAYHTETKSSYDPPMKGMPTGNSAVDGRWTGACPAGMQPGDVVLPDGRKVNMRNMAGGPAGGGAPAGSAPAGPPPKK